MRTDFRADFPYFGKKGVKVWFYAVGSNANGPVNIYTATTGITFKITVNPDQTVEVFDKDNIIPRESLPDMVDDIKIKAYDALSDHLSSASPYSWANFMFGGYDPPEYFNKGNMADWIIAMNDYDGLTREEIADRIDEAFADNPPKISMFPLSWMLAPSTLEVVE